MYHTVGKLAALAIVVGIGVAVVVHAQRGMPTGEQTVTDSDTDAKSDDDQVVQSEPEIASDDETDVVPAASKMKFGSKRDPKIVKTGGRLRGEDAEVDDDFATGPATRKNTTSDPFASGDGGDDEPKDRPARPVSRKSAAESRPAISIVDLDDEDPLSGIDDSPAAKRKTASTSRGSVLSLDDDAEDDLNKPARKATSRPKSSSGPRLLGATDDEAEKPMSSELDADDLPTDDDSAPARKPRRDPVTLDDDLDLSDEKETPAPPRKLADDAKLGQPGRKLPGADLKDDDDLTIDTTPSRRSDLDDEIPIRTKPKSLDLEDEPAEPDLDLSRKATDEVNRPAELGRTIEIDESIPNTPSPRKAALPQITIEKHAPATAVLGRPMVYTILVKNIGPTPAHQVVVEDVIPVEFQIDGSIPQALLKDDKLIWKLGTLPAGQAKKISVRVVPQSEGTTGGVATVTFSGEPVRPQASAPRLKFDVSAPRQAAIGTPVEFNFHVRNVGTVPANGVTIRDVLPAGLKHPDGDDLEYNLGELPAGKSQDVKLTLTAAQAGPTINRVVVTADGDVAEEAQVQLDVVGPTLLVSRSGPKKMIPGKTASFSSTVTNPGTGAVTGVSVVEKIPPGMEFVDAGEGGVYDQAKRIVFWSIRQLAAGEARTVTLSLRSVSRGAQISVIRAYDSSGSTGEATGATKVAGVPALTIEVGEIPALIEAGEIVKVPVRILNRGSDTATAVKAKITVPPELQILSADGPTSYREKSTAPDERRGVSPIEVQFAPIDKIEPRAEALFEVTIKADAGASGALRIEVQAHCDQLPDPIRRQEVITVAQ